MVNTRLRLSGNFITKLVASYLVIICIPLAVVGILYIQASGEISRQNQMFAEEQANYTRSTFENSVAEINRLLNALLSDDDVLSALYEQNPLTKHERTYSALQIQRRLYSLTVSSSLYSDILLYHFTEDYIITSEAVYLRPELFPAAYARKYPGYRWDESFFELLERDETSAERWLIYPSADGESSMLLRVAALSRMGRRVYVVLPVSMTALMKRLEPEFSGSLVALDAEGRCMTDNSELWKSLTLDESTRMATSGDGRRYLYSDSSALCGIRLIHLKLSSSAENAAAALRTSFILLLVFGALTSVIVGLVMVFFQTRPLYRVFELLFGKMPTQFSAYSWETLSDRIEQLIQDNQSLSDKRRRQLVETKRYMLEALFSHAENPDEIIARMERMGLKPHDAFHLITCFFQSNEECTRMGDAICRRFPEAFSHCVVDGCSLAMLIRASELCEADANSRLRSMKAECERAGVVPPRMAMDPIPELVCVDSFYREQLMTVEIAGAEAAGEVLRISNDIFGDQDVFYPVALEQQITAGILSGSVGQVSAVLGVICQENFSVRRITDIKSRLVTERLSIALSGALFRLSILPDAIKLHTMQAIARCKHQNDYREFAPSVMEILTPILELIRARSETPRQPQPGEQIVEYLRSHLSEPSLCLSALAEHFQMSESSVSGLIRSATGESYKAYCDRIRVNRACALLKSGASVQDACGQSGFSSAATFRRTFKKLMGVPPSEYLAAPDEDGEAEKAQ